MGGPRRYTGRSETQPATSEEAQQAIAEWNSRCVTRPVDPPIKVDGWGPAGELRVWLLADDGWWGLVSGTDGMRWMRAEDLRPAAQPCHPRMLERLGPEVIDGHFT
jgi:hypothetical protein